MFISLYKENLSHITNITHATHDTTVRIYDFNSFTSAGNCDEDTTEAKVAVLNDDAGNYKYACFVDGITPDGLKQTVKGLDLKTLWDTEVLFDFTVNSFDGRLSKIFEKVKALVFDSADAAVQTIPVEVEIPEDLTNTVGAFGDYSGTYFYKNAYAFLKGYLKYYEYNIDSRYDPAEGKIVFSFVKCTQTLDINLNDFIYELTTTSSATNKAIATMKPPEGVSPSSVSAKYYYRKTDNSIVVYNAETTISGRIYPVKQKYFEAEYLADAQFNAVYELANARYVDNIIIDNTKTRDPIDFSIYPLYTKVNLYYKEKLYKTLPITEKNISLSSNGEKVKIKLGFKKILLTEIIKGGSSND